MLSLVRDSLLTNDFASNMKMLQNYPELDMRLILEKARQLGSPAGHQRLYTRIIEIMEFLEADKRYSANINPMCNGTPI